MEEITDMFIWIVIIGFFVYLIFSKNKKNNVSLKKNERSNNFIGRHQYFCRIKKFLGEEVPVLELQIATNKDISERSEIINKLEEIEKYMNSGMFTDYLDVRVVNEDIGKLIQECYKKSIFRNDVISQRCYKILDDTDKYLEKYLESDNGVEREEFNKKVNSLRNLYELQFTLNQISLGGLLEEPSDEQKAWIIMNSIVYNNGLVKTSSLILPPEPAESAAENLKNFAIKLLKENIISDSDFQKIDIEIKDGLAEGKEFYKEKFGL